MKDSHMPIDQTVLSQKVDEKVRATLGELTMQTIVLRTLLDMHAEAAAPTPHTPTPNPKPQPVPPNDPVPPRTPPSPVEEPHAAKSGNGAWRGV
jgi:hypothetical protein